MGGNLVTLMISPGDGSSSGCIFLREDVSSISGSGLSRVRPMGHRRPTMRFSVAQQVFLVEKNKKTFISPVCNSGWSSYGRKNLEVFTRCFSCGPLSLRHVRHAVSNSPCLSASISQSVHLSPSYPLPARRSVRITWRQVGQHGRR